MKIVQHSKHVTSVTYDRVFSYDPDCFTAGFGFPCDVSGEVLEPSNNCAKDNYRKCLTGEVDGHRVYDLGVKRYEHTYLEPAIGLCECGEEVELRNFTNTCECGADYNTSGQRLAPREYWGEETGEHWTDCY